jgi:tRNA (pseudouridine54-N1)-methyltransferase
MMIESEELGRRRFLFVSHRTPTNGDFNLNDLPGSGGRVDVLARCIGSSLLVSNAIRRDASVSIYFSGDGAEGISVVVSGSRVTHLTPDERSTSALLRNALVKARIQNEGESSPGIYFSHVGLGPLAGMLSEGCTTYYLKEDGKKSPRLCLPALFIIGDSRDLSREEESILPKAVTGPISISRTSLQSDQCATILNWMLDNDMAPDKL